MTLSKEEMRVYMAERRKAGKDVNQPCKPESVNLECKPCECRERKPAEGARTLTYTKRESTLDWFPPITVAPAELTCPCCGKVWLSKRPDLEDGYCARCVGPVADWRAVHPYTRPEMQPRSVLGL